MTLFQNIRRRKTAIMRAVLPVIAVVWGNALASPCFGMSVEALGKPATEAPAHTDHSATVHGDDAAPTHHDHAPLTHDVSCPHCPAGSQHEDPGSHIACSTLDDLADAGGQVSIAKWQLEHILPIAISVAPTEIRHRLSSAPIARTARPVSSAVPLHLRHCVFLI